MADVDQLRIELREIGRRREVLNAAVTALAVETAGAVEKARGLLSVTEVARLVGLDRSHLYRSYDA